MFGLDYLLSPFAAGEFMDNYWGKRALHIPGDSGKFAELYGWDAVNELLLSSRDFNGVRLIHDKRDLGRREFERLDHWLQQGATLAINSVNSVDPVLSKFASVLGHELNTRVNINSYMSYPTKQGFDNHADRHDVFIVHTEGEKDWAVFPPTMTYPLHKQRNQDPGEPPDAGPYLECRMTPGDVMYIPRGHWHYAQSTTPSIHLTVGPVSTSASEFMLWWAHELMDGDEFYRKDFPLIRSDLLGGERDSKAFDGHLNEFRQRLRAMLDDDEMMRQYLVRYSLLHNTTPKEYHLPSAWENGHDISLQTKLSVHEDQKFVVYCDEDTRFARIVIRGGEIELQGIPRGLLADLLSCQGPGAGQTCEEILESHPDCDWQAFTGWVLQLRDGGLMTLAR